MLSPLFLVSIPFLLLHFEEHRVVASLQIVLLSLQKERRSKLQLTKPANPTTPCVLEGVKCSFSLITYIENSLSILLHLLRKYVTPAFI